MRYIRLNLDFYHPWANNSGYYVARARGYYKEAGIDLDITPYDPFREDSLHRLQRGEVDIACNYPQRLMKHVEAGEHMVSIAAVNADSFESLLYDARRPLSGVEDLAGKRVATPRSPRVRAVLRYLLEREGADPEQISFVEYYPAEPDPLEIESGAFDAVWGSYWPWEGVIARLRNPNIRWKTVHDLAAPYVHNQCLAVRKQLLHDESTLVRDFLWATRRGFQEAADDPAAAAELMVFVAPYYTVREFQEAITQCRNSWQMDTWGYHDFQLIANYAAWLHDHGFLNQKQSFSESFINDLL